MGDTVTARTTLRQAVVEVADAIWREEGRSPARFDGIYDSISELVPKDRPPAEPADPGDEPDPRSRAFAVVALRPERQLILTPLLVIVVFWLTINFVSFGLFASRNPTVLAALFVGALSVAGAVYIILEMDSPFRGLLRISEAPMRTVVEQMGH